MERRTILAGAAALAAAGAARPGHAAGRNEDEAAVRAVLDEYAASWQAGDAARMFANATPDIHWVNIVGMHWQGKRDVELAHKVYLETIFRGVPMTLETIENIVPIGRDALAVVARWTVGAFKTPAGFAVPQSKDRMSLILLRGPKGFQIAHVANIQIDERAAANDPIKPRAG